MPEVTEIFLSNALIWTSSGNGSPGGIGTATADIDTTSNRTEQVLSEGFTITDPPPGSVDGLWDSVTFTAKITHENLSGPSGDQDVGVVVFRLVGTSGGSNPSHNFSVKVADEDGPAGTFVHNVDVIFYDVPPGTYRIFAGEINAGDGEALKVSVDSGKATEVICFCAGTKISTPYGSTPVEELKQGDFVYTKDSGPQQILWINTKEICNEALSQKENLRPVRIKEGALGENIPNQDLVVSQQHRVMISSQIANRMFGRNEVLCAAKHLIGLPGVEIDYDMTNVSYTHFLLKAHEIVYSNGAQTESLFTGPMALKSLSIEQRREIFDIFPELSDIDYTALPCRPLVNGRQVRKLVERHQKNSKPLIVNY